MNEQERIELLKAVAECAPMEMRARLSEGIFVKYKVNFHDAYCALYLDPSSKDAEGVLARDAEAMISMLDAMEGAGYIAAVYPNFRVPQGSPLTYFVKLKRDSDGITMLATIHGGSTRAEAVARAFVAVFGEKAGSNGGGE